MLILSVFTFSHKVIQLGGPFFPFECLHICWAYSILICTQYIFAPKPDVKGQHTQSHSKMYWVSKSVWSKYIYTHPLSFPKPKHSSLICVFFWLGAVSCIGGVSMYFSQVPRSPSIPAEPHRRLHPTPRWRSRCPRGTPCRRRTTGRSRPRGARAAPFSALTSHRVFVYWYNDLLIRPKKNSKQHAHAVWRFSPKPNKINARMQP